MDKVFQVVWAFIWRRVKAILLFAVLIVVWGAVAVGALMVLENSGTVQSTNMGIPVLFLSVVLAGVHTFYIMNKRQ